MQFKNKCIVKVGIALSHKVGEKQTKTKYCAPCSWVFKKKVETSNSFFLDGSFQLISSQNQSHWFIQVRLIWFPSSIHWLCDPVSAGNSPLVGKIIGEYRFKILHVCSTQEIKSCGVWNSAWVNKWHQTFCCCCWENHPFNITLNCAALSPMALIVIFAILCDHNGSVAKECAWNKCE